MTMIGRTLSHFRIASRIGAGGMGEVYLARDTQLDRDVAIKVLPAAVAGDAERLARFEREAKLLASLNHPNIAAIYGVGEHDGLRFLAMELVPGEDLAARLARGALSLGEAVDVARQIAEALEASHEHGVIHRDLKPANVSLTQEGRVKVLDFGLAKALDPTPTSGSARLDPSASPTVTSLGTVAGVILGTAAYMSPEQAQGKPVDRRTDIWSFGCVLYECLTGRRPFHAETPSETLAKVLEREVDWSRLPQRTPPRIRELLARCLVKDPRHRLRDIGDARLVLEDQEAGHLEAIGAASAPRSKRFTALFIAAAMLAGGALGVFLSRRFGPTKPVASPGPLHASIKFPKDLGVFDWGIAADGQALVALARPPQLKREGGDPQPVQLFIHRFDGDAWTPLRAPEGFLGGFGSPDGKSIGYFAPASPRSSQFRLMRVPIDGSAPAVVVADWDKSWSWEVSWLDSGDYLIGVNQGKDYVRLSAGGDAHASEPHPFGIPGFTGALRFRDALPNDRGALLVANWYDRGANHIGIGVLDLQTGTAKLLVKDAGYPAYAPTGHLLFTRGDTLSAVDFDVEKLEVRGEPVPIRGGGQVGYNNTNAPFMISRNGTLLFVAGEAVGQNNRAVVVAEDGTVSEWSGERAAFELSALRASPNGGRIAQTVRGAKSLSSIWISERGRPGSRRVVAIPAGADCGSPIWSPDGRRIAYFQLGGPDAVGVYTVDLDEGATARRILRRTMDDPWVELSSWSPDGSRILGSTTVGDKAVVLDFAADPANGEVQEARPFLHGSGSRGGARFSPDGKWVAYASDETGRSQIYVCAYGENGPTGNPVLVSTDGGGNPHWSRNGKSLYYNSGDDRVMKAEFATQPTLAATAPTIAWSLGGLRIPTGTWDILPDGKLVGVQTVEAEDSYLEPEIVFNFFDEMKARLEAAKQPH